jgi:hypothetical protein
MPRDDDRRLRVWRASARKRKTDSDELRNGRIQKAGRRKEGEEERK